MFSCGGNCERMFRWWDWSVGGGLSANIHNNKYLAERAPWLPHKATSFIRPYP